MQTHNLKPRTKRVKRQEVGRGGKRGKTSGRGGKGQTARAGNKRRPELRDLIKKLPKLRGRGKSSFKSYQVRNVPVNLDVIEMSFQAGETVTPAALVERKVVNLKSGNVPLVKILGTGEITKKLEFSGFTVSASAKAKIEKAGGSVK